jgi:pheromone shutdown-related protein TraB
VTSALDSRHVKTVVYGEGDGRKTLHIIGTAHVSRASVDEVARVIREVRPDTVCVELCEARYAALIDAERWKKLDIFKVFKEGKALFLLANLAVGAYQRRLGQELGVMPGEELLKGVEVAREVGAEVVLADRDVNATLKRSWSSLSLWRKSQMLAAIIASLFEGRSEEPEKKIDMSLPDRAGEPETLQDQIEVLKDPVNVSEMMQELARALPQLKTPLIDERDLYLISNLREAPGKTIVGVVGAGHVAGMVNHLETPVDRAMLEVLPRPRWWEGLLKWVIPAILVGTFFLGLGKTEGQGFFDMLLAWILPTALCSGVATLAVGGRPVSVLTAMLCSPITTIHPLIASGMIVGPVEAWSRRPTVADCERIHQDIQSFRGFFRNPFTRTLIVTVAATLGSAIGAWIGLTWVISIAA